MYVNVCKWSRVPPPKSDADPIPVKGGTLRYLVKKGAKTDNYLFDVAFNPKVVEECMKDATMLDMLNSLSLDFISDITRLLIYRNTFMKLRNSFNGPESDIQCSLDEQLKDGLTPASKLDIGDSLLDQLANLNTLSESTLPSLKLHPDTKPGKLIEEIPLHASHPPAKPGEEKKADTKQAVKVPSFTLEIKMTDDGRKILTIVVSLNGVSSVKDVELEVSQVNTNHFCIYIYNSSSQDELYLYVPIMYKLTLPFHSPVDEDQVSAEFSLKKSELTITVPILPK